MSEQTAEQTTPETPEVVIPDSPLVTAGRAEYETLATQANELFGKVQAAENVNATIAEVRNSSEDETIVKFRDWLEKANARIIAETDKVDAYIKANLVSQEPVDVEAVKASHKELVTKAKALRTVLTQFAGDNAIHGLPELKSLSGRAVSAGAGTGGKRPRLQTVKVGEKEIYSEKKEDDGTVTHVASFTVLAAWMSKDAKVKVEPKQLQEAAFAAAGTDDLSTLAGKPVTFAITVGEGANLKTYPEITVIPKVADK